MSKSTMRVLANMARNKCANERLAHEVADVIERSADLATAARDVQAMLGRHQPSAKLSALADVLYDEARIARPVNPNGFRVAAANPTEPFRDEAEAAYRERRMAELAQTAKAIRPSRIV